MVVVLWLIYFNCYRRFSSNDGHGNLCERFNIWHYVLDLFVATPIQRFSMNYLFFAEWKMLKCLSTIDRKFRAHPKKPRRTKYEFLFYDHTHTQSEWSQITWKKMRRMKRWECIFRFTYGLHTRPSAQLIGVQCAMLHCFAFHMRIFSKNMVVSLFNDLSSYNFVYKRKCQFKPCLWCCCRIAMELKNKK